MAEISRSIAQFFKDLVSTMKCFLSTCLCALVMWSSVVAGLKKPPSLLNPQQSAKFSTLVDLPGVVAPTGYFDPLGLSSKVSDETLKKWREAEIKHGRVSMLVSDFFHFHFHFSIRFKCCFTFITLIINNKGCNWNPDPRELSTSVRRKSAGCCYLPLPAGGSAVPTVLVSHFAGYWHH